MLEYATGYPIAKGLAVENVFAWITIYVFGAFLVGTGVKMFFFTGKPAVLGGNPLLRWMRG